MPTLRDYVNSMPSKGAGSPVAYADNPFEEATVVGWYTWATSPSSMYWHSSFPSGNNLLQLNDSDNWFDGRTSGAAKFRLKAGWEVRFIVSTPNDGYFESISSGDSAVSDPLSEHFGWTLGGRGGRSLGFTLTDGDWLSIDVDERFVGINSFTLGRVSGLSGSSTSWRHPDNINDEAFIGLVSVVNIRGAANPVPPLHDPGVEHEEERILPPLPDPTLPIAVGGTLILVALAIGVAIALR